MLNPLIIRILQISFFFVTNTYLYCQVLSINAVDNCNRTFTANTSPSSNLISSYSGCSNSTFNGKEYIINVDKQNDYDVIWVTLWNRSNLDFDLFLYDQSGETCLQASTDPVRNCSSGLINYEKIEIAGAAGFYQVIVDSERHNGEFNIHISCEGSNCDQSRELTCENSPVSGDTRGKQSYRANYPDCAPFNGCFEWSGSFTGPEEYWEFTAPQAGVYTFELNGSSTSSLIDLELFILSQCCETEFNDEYQAVVLANVACRESCELDGTSQGSNESRKVLMDAGETKWLVVDGFLGSADAYTLSVTGPSCGAARGDCSTPAARMSCGDVLNRSITSTDDDNYRVDTYSDTDCYNGNVTNNPFDGYDEVIRIDAGSSAITLTIDLYNLGANLDMFLYDRCITTSDEPDGALRDCVGAGINTSTSPRQIVLPNASGIYYLVIDGYRQGENGNYSLEVSCSLEEDKGDCRTPAARMGCGDVLNRSITSTDDDNYRVDTYSDTDCYNGNVTNNPFDGYDEVIRIDAGSSAITLTIDLYNLGANLDMFLYDRCITTSDEPDGALRDCVGAGINTSTSPRQIVLPNASGIYYLVIDGYRQGENGNYSLAVSCEGCTDLSDQYGPFMVHPADEADGSYVIDTPEGIPNNGTWDIDGQTVENDNFNFTKFTPATGVITICYEWTEIIEGSEECYRICKKYRIPSNPYECDDIWVIPYTDNPDSPFKFKSEKDVAAWILHEPGAFIDFRTSENDFCQSGEENIETCFNPRMYASTNQLSYGVNQYMSVLFYDETNDIYDICCRAYCFPEESHFVSCGQDIITASFIGSQEEVSQGNFTYRFSSSTMLPPSATVIGWKVYPTYDQNRIQTSQSVVADFTVQTIIEEDIFVNNYTVCMLYEQDGCIRICCVDICLENPFECEVINECQNFELKESDRFFTDNIAAGTLVTTQPGWTIVDPSFNASAEMRNGLIIDQNFRGTGSPSYVRKQLSNTTSDQVKLELNISILNQAAKMGINGGIDVLIEVFGGITTYQIYDLIITENSSLFNNEIELIYTEGGQVKVQINDIDYGFTTHTGIPQFLEFCGNSGTYVLNEYSFYDCSTGEGDNNDCDGETTTVSGLGNVAYWTNAQGERLTAFDGQNTLTVPNTSGRPGRNYVYCYYYDCDDQVPAAQLTVIGGCRLKVCCIPLPFCTDEIKCNETKLYTTIGKENSFSFSDYDDCWEGDFDAPDHVIKLIKDFEGPMTVTMTQLANGSPSSAVNMSLFVLSDLENLTFVDNSLEISNRSNLCKGRNLQPVNIGEEWTDRDNPLPVGTYYIIVDALESNRVSDFSISIECEEEECIDLPNSYPWCFGWRPLPDYEVSGGYILDFDTGVTGLPTEVRNADRESIVWFSGGVEIGRGIQPITYPPGTGTEEICVEWRVPTGDGESFRCYRYCKRICFADPFDCDRLWWYPNDQTDTEFTFVANDDIDVISWELHDELETFNYDLTDDKEFSYDMSGFEEGKCIWVTLTYQDGNGCVKICCKKICITDKHCGRDLIRPRLISSESDLELPNPRYRYEILNPLSGDSHLEFVKWKYYPINIGGSIEESTSTDLSVSWIKDISLDIDPIYRVCLTYMEDGCYKTCCIDICLRNPYGCGVPAPRCEEGGYEISSLLGDNIELLYWSDGDQILEEFGSQMTIDYTPTSGQRYIYCYYTECTSSGGQLSSGDQLKTGNNKSNLFLGDCVYKVCCIPLPDCEERCYQTDCENDDIITQLIRDRNPTSYEECINADNGERIIVLNFDPLPMSVDDEFSELYSCDGTFLEVQNFIEGSIILEECKSIKQVSCPGDCYDNCCTGVNVWLEDIKAAASLRCKECPDGSANTIISQCINDIGQCYYKILEVGCSNGGFNVVTNIERLLNCDGSDYIPHPNSISEECQIIWDCSFERKECSNCYTSCCDSKEFIDGFIDGLLSQNCTTGIPSECPYDYMSIYQCKWRGQCVYNVIDDDPEISQVFGTLYNCDGDPIRTYALPGDGSFDPTELINCQLIWSKGTGKIEACESLCEEMQEVSCVDFENYNVDTPIANHPRWSVTNNGFESCRIGSMNGNKYLSIMEVNNQTCEAQYSLPSSNAEVIKLEYKIIIEDNSGIQSQYYDSSNQQFGNFINIITNNGQAEVNYQIGDVFMDYTPISIPIGDWFTISLELNRINGLQTLDIAENRIVSSATSSMRNLTEVWWDTNLTRSNKEVKVDDICFYECEGEKCPPRQYIDNCNFLSIRSITPESNNFDISLNSSNIPGEIIGYELDIEGESIQRFTTSDFIGSFRCPSDRKCKLYVIYIDDEGCEVACCIPIFIPRTCGVFIPTYDGDGSGDDLVYSLEPVGDIIPAYYYWVEGDMISNDGRFDFADSGTQTICCVYFDPFANCWSICCFEVCVFNPFDPSNCDDIVISQLDEDTYQLSLFELPGAPLNSDIVWTIDLPTGNVVIGTDNPHLFKPSDFNISDLTDITISVSYIDSDGCYRTCCRRLCRPSDNHVNTDIESDFCDDIEFRYKGEGLIYEFSLPDQLLENDIMIVSGRKENDGMGNASVGKIEYVAFDEVVIDEFGFTQVDLANYDGDENVVVCIEYIDDDGCLKQCCREICVFQAPINSPDCDLMSYEFIGDRERQYQYSFTISEQKATDISWTVHTASGGQLMNIEGDNNIEIDFIELGYLVGAKVCVTVVYFDVNDMCYKTCCVCFCLSDPYSCGFIEETIEEDILLLSVSGSVSQEIWFLEDGTQISSQVPLAELPINDDKVTICVLYFDELNNCYRYCCKEICINSSIDCEDYGLGWVQVAPGLIEPGFNDNGLPPVQEFTIADPTGNVEQLNLAGATILSLDRAGIYELCILIQNSCGVSEQCCEQIDNRPDNDGDGWPQPNDCDDNNPDINPGEIEIPGNGIDEDCDPTNDGDDSNKTVSLSIGTVCGTVGNQVRVPILVRNFELIDSATFTFELSNDFGRFIRLESDLGERVVFNLLTQSATSTRLMEVRILSKGNPIVLPDGTSLFELIVQIQNDGEKESSIEFRDSPTPSVMLNDDLISVEFNRGSGSICLQTTNSIGGVILSREGEAIEDVNLILSNDNETFEFMTDENGAFIVDGESLIDYTLSAHRDVNILNGVSPQDILLLKRHINARRNGSINDPLIKIAGDINDDKRLSISDITELRSLILGEISEFSNNESWRFVSSATSFVDENSFDINVQDYQEIFTFMPLNRDQTDIDFTGVKIGDLNNTVLFERSKASVRNDLINSSIIINDVSFDVGDTIEVQFMSSDIVDVTGMLLEISFDASLNYLGFQSSDLIGFKNSDIGEAFIEENKLIVLWIDNSLEGVTLNAEDKIVSLHFVANRAGQLSKSISLSDMYRKNEIVRSDMSASSVILDFQTTTSTKEYSNYNIKVSVLPTPFSQQGLLKVDGIQNLTNSYLSLFNVNGELLSRVKLSGSQSSNNTIILDDELLNYNYGVIYYRLESEEGVDVGRIIRIRS